MERAASSKSSALAGSGGTRVKLGRFVEAQLLL